MATFAWTLQGTVATTIDVSDIIQFAGAAFGSAVFVGNFNDSTNVKTNVGLNKSLGNSPHNTKRIDSTHYQLDGGATTLLDASHPTTAQCPLKINFSHGSSVAVTNHVIYAYDGVTTTTPPVEVNFYIVEQSHSAWQLAGGSGAALAVFDHLTPATSHNFYFAVSASPSAVGLKQAFVIRDELIYS